MSLSIGGQAQELPVIVEVEDRTAGADFSEEEENGITHLSIGTNGTAGHPESEARKCICKKYTMDNMFMRKSLW